MHEDLRRDADSKRVNAVVIGDSLLPDVVYFLRTQAIWIVSALVIGGLIGTGIALTKPKQWEAASMVQIGQVGYLDPPGSVGAIETVPNTVERITGLVKQGPEDQIFMSKQIPERDIALLRSTFTAQGVPNTGFVRMSVRGLSPDEARTMMQVVEAQLVSVHAKMIEPAIGRLKDAQARATADSADVYKRRAELQAQAQGAAGKPATAQDVLLNTLIDKVDAEWRDLETRRSQLAEQLSDERTFATRPIGGVTVSSQPVSPRVSYYVTGGTIIGLAIGVLIGLFRHVGRAVRRS